MSLEVELGEERAKGNSACTPPRPRTLVRAGSCFNPFRVSGLLGPRVT